jgi:hypothetical protein
VIGAGLHSIRLLLDQGIPAEAALLFRESGCDCQHIPELGMHKAEDEEILAFGHDNGCVAITRERASRYLSPAEVNRHALWRALSLEKTK